MRHLRTLGIIACLGLCIALPTRPGAAKENQLDNAALKRLERVRDEATHIVVARLRATQSYRTAGLIYTDHAFEVEEQLKGEGPATLTVTLPGGIVDGYGMRLVGTPVPRMNQRYVLFLNRRRGNWRLQRFDEGIYGAKALRDGLGSAWRARLQQGGP